MNGTGITDIKGNRRNPNVSLDRFWYALYTKPRHEFKAASYLSQLEIENYLPTIEVMKQWSDRKKKIVEPLFKSYIFIFGNEKERLQALQNDAVISTVSFQGRPAKIPECQILNLKRLLEEKHEIFVSDLIEVGAKVKISEGPFSGVEGIVVQRDGKGQMLGVSVDLLRRSVLVRLPKESIIKTIE